MLAFWGETIRVAAITETKQKDFAEDAIAKGHSLSYISRNLSVLAAAFAHAKIDQKVIFGKSQMVERWALQPKAPRRAFIPTDDEVAKLLALPLAEDFWRWLIMSLLTGGRPEAVLELTPAQRERDSGLLDLNPPGRRQNKKHRPAVREPKALTAWLDRWESEMLAARLKREVGALSVDISRDRYCSYASVESVQTAIERLRSKNTKKTVNLPRLSAYSFRHKVATVLRKARQSEDEIGLQLGHRRESARTTAGYGEWDPDYLNGVADALDAWFAQLQGRVKGKSLFAVPLRKKRRARGRRRA